jgi:hypothetical protein
VEQEMRLLLEWEWEWEWVCARFVKSVLAHMGDLADPSRRNTENRRTFTFTDTAREKKNGLM